MKAYRTFTIDYEIAELLSKEENQSKIINDLLKSYFNAKTPKTLEEMEKELKRLDAKKAYAMALEAIGR